MRWYFDFISPYAYLQSTRLARLSRLDTVQCVPLLFAGLLKHWGHIGPAELPPKRDFTFRHVAYIAHRDGIALTFPPHHPFNPLPLLRLSQALGNDLASVQRIFRFVWEQGHTPDDATAFDALLNELGVGRQALADPAIKQALQRNGEQAIADQVFGVPTVVYAGETYWGDDATDMVLASAGRNDHPHAWPAAAIAAARALPQGPARPRPAPAPVIPPDPSSHAPRIPYLPIDLKEPADIVRAVRERRGGALIELDRMLLYSPELAMGWNHLLGNVRTRFEVEPRLRELAMCLVAVLNRAEYEFFQHSPLLLAAGATQAQVDALRDPDAARANEALFSDLERAPASA
ncbi:MAG: DsbA family protein [Burkholderiaceae bacterium]